MGKCIFRKPQTQSEAWFSSGCSFWWRWQYCCWFCTDNKNTNCWAAFLLISLNLPSAPILKQIQKASGQTEPVLSGIDERIIYRSLESFKASITAEAINYKEDDWATVSIRRESRGREKNPTHADLHRDNRRPVLAAGFPGGWRAPGVVLLPGQRTRHAARELLFR